MTTNLRVTYLDTAMVLIEIGGLRLLTDPVLDPKGTTIEDGHVRLVKAADAPTTAAALGHIDAVLLSHDQHADNLDGAGRKFVAGVARVLTTPTAAERLGGAAEGLEPWSTTTLESPDGLRLEVTAVPAQHAPDGLHEIVGPVTGFVIAPADGSTRPLYISGDTIRFAGTAEIARRFAPIGVALLHLGRAQVAPLGEVSLSLSAAEAAEYAEELRADTLIPIHFEGWEHFTEGRAAAEPIFEAHGLASRTRWLNRGERVELVLPAK